MSLGSHLVWAPVTEKVATPDVSLAMERIAQPFSGSLSFVPVAAGAANWIPIAILGLWVCGFVAIALIRLRSWLRIRAAVIVRERATGRMFGETIDFEVK